MLSRTMIETIRNDPDYNAAADDAGQRAVAVIAPMTAQEEDALISQRINSWFPAKHILWACISSALRA